MIVSIGIRSEKSNFENIVNISPRFNIELLLPNNFGKVIYTS